MKAISMGGKKPPICAAVLVAEKRAPDSLAPAKSA